MELTFYDYWASSAAYRVRIALNLKGVDFRGVEIDLLHNDHMAEGYRALNPQGLVPALVVNGETVIGQSLAIIDFLDAEFPEPRMVPREPLARAKVLGQALTVACDIHPLNNLRVRRYLKNELGVDERGDERWMHHWMSEGFAALEAGAPEEGMFGGETPNLADVCLVPQMFNARRFKLPLELYPRLVRIDNACRALDSFAQAAPEAVRPK